MAECALHIVEASRGGIFGYAESNNEGDDTCPTSSAECENGGGLTEEEICGCLRGYAATDAVQATHSGLQRGRGSYYFGESFHFWLAYPARNKTRHRLRTAGEFHTESGTPRARPG